MSKGIIPHSWFETSTPDEVAECWDGIIDVPNLYETLWSFVPEYQQFDREDCGPYDVIGINSVTTYWDRIPPELQTELNRLADKRERELRTQLGEFTYIPELPEEFDR